MKKNSSKKISKKLIFCIIISAFLLINGQLIFASDLLTNELDNNKLASLISNPLVMVVLLTIGFIGIAGELVISGLGLLGFVGILALLTYFAGHIIAGIASYGVLILFFVGIILLLFEFFIPGFGVMGIAGIISMCTAIVMASLNTMLGLKTLAISLILALIVIIVLAKYFGSRGMWSRIILRDSQENKDGYSAPKIQAELVNTVGRAITPLRPAGTADFDGNIVDVVAETGYIATGQAVQVIKVEGVRVVVREYNK